MNTTIRIAALLTIGFVVIAGGTLLALKKTASTIPAISPETRNNNQISGTPRMPWIEVVRPRAIEYSSRDGGSSRTLKTGDEVAIGKMIETDGQGIANIYFPDGSVLRLDSKTKVVLDQAEPDSENKGMTARIFLAAGRAWSKVLPLLTPDSLWEVKTSNAVATVRGTAFGVSVIKGKTSVIGSERTVAVQAIDPNTQKTVGKEVVVAPDKLVEVVEKDIPLIKEAKKELSVTTAPIKMLADPWVTNAKTEDKRYEEKIEEMKTKGIERSAAQEELRTKARAETVESDTEKPVESPSNNKPEDEAESAPTPSTREDIPVSGNTPPPAKRPEQKGAPAPVPPAGRPVLTIRATQNLAQIIEGNRITFEAILVWPNGQTKNVTAAAQWQVVGPVGKITGPGILTAELTPEAAEFGTVPGAVVATWKDPESGEMLIGKSPIFKVDALIEDILNPEG